MSTLTLILVVLGIASCICGIISILFHALRRAIKHDIAELLKNNEHITHHTNAKKI